MNERIRELAKQARRYAQQYVNESVIDYGKHASEFSRIYESKFVELIVEECARIGELKELGCNGYDPNISIGWYMKQHFGVK